MSFWRGDLSNLRDKDIEFLKTVSELSGLSMALWMTGRQLSDGSWTSCRDSVHPCFTMEKLRRSLEGYCRGERPCIYLESDQIIYGIMSIGPSSLALGPAALWTPSEDQLQAYASWHELKDPIPIPKKDPDVIMRLMNLICLHFTDTSFPMEEIHVTNHVLEEWESTGALEKYQLDQSENDREHQIGVDFENDMMELVRNGDLDSIRTLITGKTVDFSKIGDFSSEQNKTNEYLIVSVIALLTRAAVSGGVGLETAHQLGDVYLKRLSRAVLEHEPFLILGYRAIIEFTELVRRSKEERSGLSYVNTCKEYIEKNLRKDLQVGDIAPAIGLSRTYLSRLFREAEGITLQQYIQKEKCRHAAQMLQYSDFSIAEIAQYFGFSSQSYFGSCFQNWYGMTPNTYRKEKR